MAANTDLTEEHVRGFFTTLSNWGKWGPTDQLGALNYITPEKRRRAGAEVRDGHSVSLSLPLATRPAPDNPTPVTHLMIQTGRAARAVVWWMHRIAPTILPSHHMDWRIRILTPFVTCSARGRCITGTQLVTSPARALQ